MILSRSYHEIMEKIEVTDEMRSRVRNNLSVHTMEKNRKKAYLFNWKKITSMAAGIILLLICGTFMKNVIQINQDGTSIENENPVSEIIECQSVDILSKKAGFEVQDIRKIPFEIVSKSYQWCWGELAQIEYGGENDTVIYRKAEGEEDISGDYSEYQKVCNEKIGDINVQIKGDEELYYLAVWYWDGYSYSISIEQGTTYENIIEMVKSIIN